MSPRTAIDRRYWASPKGKYCRHKANANRRGVAFSLSFDQWWDIWKSSGKWFQRGNRKGTYQMCRYGDRGGYELGNVYIGLQETNTAERNRTVVDRINSGLGIQKSTESEEAPF